jgi:superfamily I DNA/RNA helicase
MPTWTPSAYQQSIFEHVGRGERDLVVQAYAGCGKTSTIVEASRHLPRGRRVGMTAFNTRIIDTLKAQVRGVDVKTFHSFGMQTICRVFGNVQGLPRPLETT